MAIPAQPDPERLVITIVFQDLGGRGAERRRGANGHPLLVADRKALKNDPAARGTAFGAIQDIAREHGFLDED